MGKQNTSNVSDKVPAQDKAIRLTNTDILSTTHYKQIQWHLNETTTIFIREGPKYYL